MPRAASLCKAASRPRHLRRRDAVTRTLPVAGKTERTGEELCFFRSRTRFPVSIPWAANREAAQFRRRLRNACSVLFRFVLFYSRWSWYQLNPGVSAAVEVERRGRGPARSAAVREALTWLSIGASSSISVSWCMKGGFLEEVVPERATEVPVEIAWAGVSGAAGAGGGGKK